MMETTKLFLLLCLVSFGAYSEYQAGKTVHTLRAREEKQVFIKKVMSEKHEKSMKRAIELSHKTIPEGHGDPFGSVGVKKGEIVGEGWNKTRLSHDPSAHAEVGAIRDTAKKNYHGKT